MSNYTNYTIMAEVKVKVVDDQGVEVANFKLGNAAKANNGIPTRVDLEQGINSALEGLRAPLSHYAQAVLKTEKDRLG